MKKRTRIILIISLIVLLVLLVVWKISQGSNIIDKQDHFYNISLEAGKSYFLTLPYGASGRNMLLFAIHNSTRYLDIILVKNISVWDMFDEKKNYSIIDNPDLVDKSCTHVGEKSKTNLPDKEMIFTCPSYSEGSGIILYNPTNETISTRAYLGLSLIRE